MAVLWPFVCSSHDTIYKVIKSGRTIHNKVVQRVGPVVTCRMTNHEDLQLVVRSCLRALTIWNGKSGKAPVTAGLRPCYYLVETKNGSNHEQIVGTSDD